MGKQLRVGEGEGTGERLKEQEQSENKHRQDQPHLLQARPVETHARRSVKAASKEEPAPSMAPAAPAPGEAQQAGGRAVTPAAQHRLFNSKAARLGMPARPRGGSLVAAPGFWVCPSSG